EQLDGIFAILLDQRKHFGMDNASAGGQPLNVTLTEAGSGAERVGMVDEPFADQGDRFKATVRVLGKAGDNIPVVHAPTVLALEVLADVSPRKRCCGPHLFVARGIVIVVVGAEEKRVRGFPRKAEWSNVSYRAHHGVLFSRQSVSASARI